MRVDLSGPDESGILRIMIPPRYRDKSWSADIGLIQRSINQLRPGVNSLHISFEKCRWIDPLPALSILMESVRAKLIGIKVRTYFPKPDGGPRRGEKGPYQSSPNRLLLFFAREGFFHQLLSYGIGARIGTTRLTSDVVEACKTLPATASYADASFIPMYLFDVPEIVDGEHPNNSFAASTVGELLSEVESRLHSRGSTTERRHLLYTLRAVLQEFIHNVQEHAYEGEAFRPLGVYVRYRKGGVGLSSPVEREFYELCAKAERAECRRVGSDWLDSRRGCLEVFVIDRGLGISRTLSGTREDFRAYERTMKRAFIKGESSKKVRMTEHGGLYLLHKLLSRSNDYIRAIEDCSWFGSAVPFNRPNEAVTNQVLRLPPGKGLIGLGYHARLSWKSSTEEVDKWLRFSDTDVKEILQKVLRDETNPEAVLPTNAVIIDERFGITVRSGETSESTVYLIWLPPRNMMKLDVLDRLETLVTKIKDKCLIIIADIPSLEAAVYEAAISRSDFGCRETWPNKIAAIALATNRWSFAYAEHVLRNSGNHGFSELVNDEVPDYFRIGIDEKKKKLAFGKLIVEWLKWHDSKCFWNEVGNSERLYLPERVIWNDDKDPSIYLEIDGYLDFSAVSHNRYCVSLLRNALGRILGLLDEKTTELAPVDSLAEPIVHEVYANEIYDPPSHGAEDISKLAVGSVLVSGSTLEAIGLSKNCIHFFVHGSSRIAGQYPSLFYWMPTKEIDKNQPPQKRIGKTAAIAPEGWLSIEVPRKHTKEELNGARTPRETYDDWQSAGPIIAKAGHWSYEGHHDFLTINIPDAVDDAFARNGPLAQFLVKNVLSHLGAENESVRGNYPGYAPASRDDLGGYSDRS